jgi:hypothetical protein
MAMRSLAKWPTGLAVALSAPLAVAQSNLGDLLDAGGKRLSAEDFKRELVQRVLVGPTPLGSELEIVYAPTGSIQGIGGNPLDTPGSFRRTMPVSGEWKLGDGERICSQMQITPTTGMPTTLAARCQFWFKLGDVYFVSDSDFDRRATILKRTIKPGSAVAAAPDDLGQLLDAGGRKLSVAEFRRDLAQRTIAGPLPNGGEVELMYADNGSIQGVAQAYPNFPWNSTVGGEWSTGEGNRVCTAMQIRPASAQVIVVPLRCQTWFRLGHDYYVADSDTDRRAKVLRRTIKPGSAVATVPNDLGQLLDAGGRKLSVAEFKRDVVQRPLVGPSSLGGEFEIVYLINGSVQATGTGAGYAQPLSMSLVTWDGEWKPDEFERICVEMRSAPYGRAKVVPRQCQLWFKLGESYYIADSDSDRRAKIWRRTIKR